MEMDGLKLGHYFNRFVIIPHEVRASTNNKIYSQAMSYYLSIVGHGQAIKNRVQGDVH